MAERLVGEPLAMLVDEPLVIDVEFAVGKPDVMDGDAHVSDGALVGRAAVARGPRGQFGGGPGGEAMRHVLRGSGQSVTGVPFEVVDSRRWRHFDEVERPGVHDVDATRQ